MFRKLEFAKAAVAKEEEVAETRLGGIPTAALPDTLTAMTDPSLTAWLASVGDVRAVVRAIITSSCPPDAAARAMKRLAGHLPPSLTILDREGMAELLGAPAPPPNILLAVDGSLSVIAGMTYAGHTYPGSSQADIEALVRGINCSRASGYGARVPLQASPVPGPCVDKVGKMHSLASCICVPKDDLLALITQVREWDALSL